MTENKSPRRRGLLKGAAIAAGAMSAAKKMPHVDGIGPADTSQNSVGRCDVAVYVSGGNNEARTLHVRASTQRARVT